jgi:hypothetical protein
VRTRRNCWHPCSCAMTNYMTRVTRSCVCNLCGSQRELVHRGRVALVRLAHATNARRIKDLDQTLSTSRSHVEKNAAYIIESLACSERGECTGVLARDDPTSPTRASDTTSCTLGSLMRGSTAYRTSLCTEHCSEHAMCHTLAEPLARPSPHCNSPLLRPLTQCIQDH